MILEWVLSSYISTKQFRQVNSDTGNVRLQDRVGLIIRAMISWTVRPRTVSVTSEGRASDHVYCGPVLPDSKRRPGSNSSETSTRSRKLSASLVIKKTFIMKTFKHEDIQIWCPASKEATLLPEDPSARRSSNIPSPIFCPSLELSSYGISYIT